MAKERDKKDKYSVTEVGTLIESFQKDLGSVAGEVRGFSDWRGEVNLRLESIEGRLTRIEDAVRVSVPDHSKRLSRLEAKVGL